jgi:hypothetical protein
MGASACMAGMCDDSDARGHVEFVPGIQSNSAFWGINSSSGISCWIVDTGDVVCALICVLICDLSFSISSSNSRFLARTRSMLPARVPPSNSLTFLSRFSMCSFVLCRMFRCASRSFARLRANCALLRCVTDRLPPRAPAMGLESCSKSKSSHPILYLSSLAPRDPCWSPWDCLSCVHSTFRL